MADNYLEIQEEQNARRAEYLYERYRPWMDVLAKSPNISLMRGNAGLTPNDAACLGAQLEQFEKYARFSGIDVWKTMESVNEEDSNTNQLGVLPKVAFDVITAVQGVSVLPLLASIQPIAEENGTVYFKNLRARDVKGNITNPNGETITSPTQNNKTLQSYASNEVSEIGAATTAAATLTYNFTLANIPIRSESLVITVQDDAATYCRDNGALDPTTPLVGTLLGSGLSGTVNYITGAVEVAFAVQPAEPKNINASYQQNYELASDLPELEHFFDNKSVKSKVYALKGTIGMLSKYTASLRFGMDIEADLARDLVAEINKEIAGEIIIKLRAGAVGLETFSRTPPDPSISFFEHKQTIKDSLSIAEKNITDNLGRGTISTIIAGNAMAATLSTLPGFTKVSDGTTIGPHVYGTLDGITVVRTSEASLLGPDEGIAMWKGSTPFEAACVYSPFMPLVVTPTVQVGQNPLNDMKAAAVMAAVTPLVPQYATKWDFSA